MDVKVILLTIITIVSWGSAGFFTKLATNKIGQKAVFFDIIAYFLGVLVYTFIVFKFKDLIQADKGGIFWALLSGLCGTFGLVSFYILMTKAEASTASPLSALYPAVAVILAFLFLHEAMTFQKILGIVFSILAIYLLTK